MNPSAAISRAARPPIHYVCGVQLRPYCIGHWFHMQREDVSFITGAPEDTLGDLLMGTLICSETFDGFTGSLRRGGIERAIRRWHRRLSGGFFGVWKRRAKFALYAACSIRPLNRFRNRFLVTPAEVLGFDFHAESEKFHAYIADHGGGPFKVNDWSFPVTRHPAAQDSGRPLRSPELAAFADALVTEGIATTQEVMDMPVPLARWRWAIHAERKGWLEILTDEDVSEENMDQERANEWARKVLSGEVKL